jgi:hypothetical protein
VDFPTTYDASSKDRWYTLEVQLIEARSATSQLPRVTMLASRQNPDRGGVLWVAKNRHAGSLVLRAERTGRTLYRRFRAEAENNLPLILRRAAVQWLLALAVHGAFFIFAYLILASAWYPPSHRA